MDAIPNISEIDILMISILD